MRRTFGDPDLGRDVESVIRGDYTYSNRSFGLWPDDPQGIPQAARRACRIVFNHVAAKCFFSGRTGCLFVDECVFSSGNNPCKFGGGRIDLCEDEAPGELQNI